MPGPLGATPTRGRTSAGSHAARPRRSAWAALPLLLISVLVAPVPGRSAGVPTLHGTWTVTGALHQARAFQTMTVLRSGQVLVAGGANSSGILASAEIYNPRTGRWTTTGSMHAPRLQFTATLLHNGQVLVAGGGSSIGTLAGAELYNARTGRWTTTGAMHTPRLFHTATLLPDGRVLVAGGVAGGCDSRGTCAGIQASAELYDPQTGAWTRTGALHQARARQTATLLPSGAVLVAGGAAGGDNVAGTNLLASAELYHPRTGRWTRTGPLQIAANAQAATLLTSGQVLVDGGFNPQYLVTGTWLRFAELYNPRTDTWTVTGPMHDPRSYQTGQTATLLGTGQVLVVGGCSSAQCAPVAGSAELYDPRTGRWTRTGSLHTPRASQPATLLPSGLVLVAGGNRGNNFASALASAELYHP